MRILVLASLLILASCATPEERALRAQQEEYARQQREAQYVANLNYRCTQLGFTEGAPDHRQCMLQLHQQNQATIGAIIRDAAAAEQQQRRAPVQTQCRNDGFGNMNCTTR